MMENVGNIDQRIRIIAGIVLLGLIYFIEGPWRWVGLAGAILIITAFIRWCPIFATLGISSNKNK